MIHMLCIYGTLIRNAISDPQRKYKLGLLIAIAIDILTVPNYTFSPLRMEFEANRKKATNILSANLCRYKYNAYICLQCAHLFAHLYVHWYRLA